ncbi:hypothetical protein RKT29_002062 [Salmonella enterica subsp. enterica serovar Lome]|uniref:Uncharacterized protein n=1 Tax=Salmonella enterica subsp. enterica serovar Abeokuta TaxID=2926665 RepID=A0A8T9IPC4_SALET|nr:hypothetical protein [Salmonella enterica]EAC0780288.1 hypothetical protein [Salmonella enterica subsp. enterica serovar Aba]ELD7742854.1 hypothetical protein [Salmonella enterica subsp. enterica serovar Lome]EAX8473329.1 hypothetical protein [Salmonella enterica]EBF8123363.1 hypothetical protein [Salmonella enterica subsp. enterica serovar Aba]EBR5151912.1 hypothetical protein [Salmonella enterica]
MNRQNCIFDAMYSYHLEKMFCTITGRIDRLITFVIILSGCSVFASVSGYMWFGAIVAALSICLVVFQFSRASGAAEEHAREYLTLITDEPELTDEALLARFKRLQASDSSTWSVLNSAAYLRSCIALGLPIPEDASELSVTEKIMSWLAGDLPRTRIAHD